MQPVGRDCSPKKEGERMRERKKEAAVGPQGQRGRGGADKRNTLFCGGVVLVERGVRVRAALREDEGYATG